MIFCDITWKDVDKAYVIFIIVMNKYKEKYFYQKSIENGINTFNAF